MLAVTAAMAPWQGARPWIAPVNQLHGQDNFKCPLAMPKVYPRQTDLPVSSTTARTPGRQGRGPSNPHRHCHCHCCHPGASRSQAGDCQDGTSRFQPDCDCQAGASRSQPDDRDCQVRCKSLRRFCCCCGARASLARQSWHVRTSWSIPCHTSSSLRRATMLTRICRTRSLPPHLNSEGAAAAAAATQLLLCRQVGLWWAGTAWPAKCSLLSRTVRALAVDWACPRGGTIEALVFLAVALALVLTAVAPAGSLALGLQRFATTSKRVGFQCHGASCTFPVCSPAVRLDRLLLSPPSSGRNSAACHAGVVGAVLAVATLLGCEDEAHSTIALATWLSLRIHRPPGRPNPGVCATWPLRLHHNDWMLAAASPLLQRQQNNQGQAC
jgi:hypothetical protein